jgi:acetyl esterase
MPLDPPIQRLFDLMGEAREAQPQPESLDERRRQADTTMLLASTGPQPDVTVGDHTVAVAGGEIAVRITRPNTFGTDPAPAFLYLHGGGWSQGNLDTAEVECGPMASAVPCVVVSVGYRLAPEHPFPTPLDDCIAAYRWLLDQAGAGALAVDPARIAVGGSSAGANLAAALCLAVRDRGLPLPRLQLLEVPCLDLTLASSPSIHDPATQVGLTGPAVAEYAGWYVPDPDDRRQPLVSPLLAPDLAGLPPAVIVVAEHDPVRDDGERYLAALHAAGVPAAAVRVLSHPHGGWVIPGTLTHQMVRDLRAGALRHALAPVLGPI